MSTISITGATSGIGLEAAVALSRPCFASGFWEAVREVSTKRDQVIPQLIDPTFRVAARIRMMAPLPEQCGIMFVKIAAMGHVLPPPAMSGPEIVNWNE